MGFIVLTRNPSNGAMIAITDSDINDKLAEFATEAEASDAAANVPVCRAWGYQIIEVE